MNDIASKFAERYKLTRREEDVIRQLAQETVVLKEIAKNLGVSHHTVNNHLKSIFEKSSMGSRSALLAHLLGMQGKEGGTFKRTPVVMVVDDEKDIVEVVTADLKRRGLRVFGFSDPKEALTALSQIPFDFLVCDIRMPELDGMELLKRIRQCHRVSPHVFFISGYTGGAEEARLMQLGASGILEKPISLEKLFQRLMDAYVDEPVDVDGLTAWPEPIQVRSQDLGHGGMFLPASRHQLSDFKVGQRIAVRLLLEGVPQSARIAGEIAWIRPEASGPLASGLGLRFLGSNDSLQESIWKAHVNRDDLAFIPEGRRSA